MELDIELGKGIGLGRSLMNRIPARHGMRI